MNVLGIWVVLAMVGISQDLSWQRLRAAVFWAIAFGIASGLLAAGVVVRISSREV